MVVFPHHQTQRESSGFLKPPQVSLDLQLHVIDELVESPGPLKSKRKYSASESLPRRNAKSSWIAVETISWSLMLRTSLKALRSACTRDGMARWSMMLGSAGSRTSSTLSRTKPSDPTSTVPSGLANLSCITQALSFALQPPCYKRPHRLIYSIVVDPVPQLQTLEAEPERVVWHVRAPSDKPPPASAASRA